MLQFSALQQNFRRYTSELYITVCLSLLESKIISLLQPSSQGQADSIAPFTESITLPELILDIDHLPKIFWSQ